MLLAVTDEAASALLASQLRTLGCVCELFAMPPGGAAATGNAAVARLRAADLLVLQLGEGAASCEVARSLAGMLPVIGVAAPEPELFFAAAKAGVESVLPLPLPTELPPRKLIEACERLKARVQDEFAPLPEMHVSEMQGYTGRTRRALHATIPRLFATSEEMAEVREMIEKVAPTSATVLLRGESGVGKELAARLIHSRSSRAREAFVKVNCAAIPNDLLESELFGYEAGAFTGATKGKPGKFELAHHGTIFLDEISEMHPMLQAKLLHVLQDGDFARLGAKRDLSVDARVICATNQSLDSLVEEGKFREDLYYRVNVITILLPPLRARKREIPELLQYFVERYARTYGKAAAPIDAATTAYLMEYDWPGNIRELENLCKRYVIVGGTSQILKDIAVRHPDGQHEDLLLCDSPAPSGAERERPIDLTPEHAITTGYQSAHSVEKEMQGPESLLAIGKRAARAAERVVIEKMLQETRWNRREAARRLNVSYKALLNKIQGLQEEAKHQ